ncbi:MAG: SDR family oxidoreductase [Bauldia sp.]|nr:SDR family oxidoreductase [Bauldia sp.]
MTDKNQPTFLVAGASGHLGRRVVELLLDAAAGPIIATTRSPEKLADLAAKGVTVRKAHHDDASSLPAAFAGADRMLLISGSDLDTRLVQHRAAIAAAAEAGVNHVVYTSATAPRPDAENALTDSHYWTEQALAASPMGWTVLRDCIYTDMLLMALPQALATGQLISATAGGGRNYVTREDCARTAVAALIDGFAGKRILDVTGPAPVTQAEIAAIVSELSGKPVTAVDIPIDDLKAGMAAAGLPPSVVAGLSGFDQDIAWGRHAITTPVVEQLTGRAPTSVRDYLAATKDAWMMAA